MDGKKTIVGICVWTVLAGVALDALPAQMKAGDTDLRMIQDHMPADSAAQTHLDLSLLQAARHSMQIALHYFCDSQQANGSWKYDPAITSLVLYSLMLEPQYHPDDRIGDAINKGYAFLEKFVKPNGGIYHEHYRNYSTAVGLMAFAVADKPKWRTPVSI